MKNVNQTIDKVLGDLDMKYFESIKKRWRSKDLALTGIENPVRNAATNVLNCVAISIIEQAKDNVLFPYGPH